jgi:two-component system, chemotaxis family, response regulator Rcp1
VGESGLNPKPAAVQRFSLRSQSHPTTKPIGRTVSVLLVEDNPADVGLLREALEEHAVDCDLIVIDNGEDASEYIAGIDARQVPCPDLVILDLNLPRKPGRDVLVSVRASVTCGQVPVVILTSSGIQADRDDAVRLGASRYIQKPTRLDDFLALGLTFKAMLSDAVN